MLAYLDFHNHPPNSYRPGFLDIRVTLKAVRNGILITM